MNERFAAAVSEEVSIECHERALLVQKQLLLMLQPLSRFITFRALSTLQLSINKPLVLDFVRLSQRTAGQPARSAPGSRTGIDLHLCEAVAIGPACSAHTHHGQASTLRRADATSWVNLLSLYRDQAKRAIAKVPPPISIAVFGPPGSGKSFAVKQIASELGGPKLIPQLEFNVSQFRGVQDLSSALQAAVTSREEKSEVTPLVFFDEFDCAWDGKELGWLKYFLGPMQDGTFQGVNGKIGPAIMVFAGGVHASFDRFDPARDSSYDNLRELDEYKRRLKLFVDQKGPDFISRLRGHINVLEINDTLGRGKHFIRRAMQLRGLLEANGRVEQGGMFNGRASIDGAIVYALLTVDRYRHGVRSMQAIVEMCSPIYGRIEIASLPPRAHLNMHVDAEEFLIRIQRGRLRAQPEWNPREETPAS